MHNSQKLASRKIVWIEAEHSECLDLAQNLVDFLDGQVFANSTNLENSAFSTDAKEVVNQTLWFNARAFNAQAPFDFLQTDEELQNSQKSEWRLGSEKSENAENRKSKWRLEGQSQKMRGLRVEPAMTAEVVHKNEWRLGSKKSENAENRKRQWCLATNRNLKNLLGTNQSKIVFDAFAGFDANSLLLLTGALVAQGWLILLTPKNWGEVPDLEYEKIASFPYEYSQLSCYFLQHAKNQLQKNYSFKITNSADLLELKQFLTKNHNKNPLSAIRFFDKSEKSPSAIGFLGFSNFSCEQKQAISVLQNNWRKRQGSVLISGIRGSGKTSCTAFALADFLQKNTSLPKIALIAANSQIAKNFLQKLEVFFDAKQLEQHINFFAPDAQIPAEFSFLIVEEAASFSASLIKNWLQKFSNSVFITTQDGYEGSNNSFKINLQNQFDEKIQLQKSFRFNQKDSLSNWLDASFFYKDNFLQEQNSKPNPKQNLALSAIDFFESASYDDKNNNHEKQENQKEHEKNIDANLEFKFISPEHLLQNLHEFRQIYALLASAHYRTRPSDIRQILDSPNAKTLAVFHKKQIIAVAFCLLEGDLPVDLLSAIATGTRRLKGHLIPQSLALSFKQPEFAKFLYLRISRIAVVPEFRRKKIASKMLDFLENNFCEQIDALATSFADKTENTNFWLENNFILIKKGEKKEKTSGFVSNQMLRVVNTNSNKIVELMQKFTDEKDFKSSN